MAKENIIKENPVAEALRKLRDEEAEIMIKLRPLQEAIGALEKIVEKSTKKLKATSGGKDSSDENSSGDENVQEESRVKVA